jgi:hypothetical protein
MSSVTDIFAKDDTHPIPDLTVCDVHGERKDGGHDLVVVIATPMQADRRSQERLIEKIARYLDFLASYDVPPAGAKNRILVKIHGESDKEVFALLERCFSWTSNHGVALEIERTPN